MIPGLQDSHLGLMSLSLSLLDNGGLLYLQLLLSLPRIQNLDLLLSLKSPERGLNSCHNCIFVVYYNYKYLRKEESLKVPNNIVRRMTFTAGTLSCLAWQYIKTMMTLRLLNNKLSWFCPIHRPQAWKILSHDSTQNCSGLRPCRCSALTTGLSYDHFNVAIPGQTAMCTWWHNQCHSIMRGDLCLGKNEPPSLCNPMWEI